MSRWITIVALALCVAIALSCQDDGDAGDRNFCLEGVECTDCGVGGDCALVPDDCDAGETQMCVGPDFFDLDDEAGRCVLCVED